MLTDLEASAALAGDRDYKLADASGLYLFVTRAGFKSWRMKYRFGGKEKRLTFGAYPDVSLDEARARRDQARALLRENVDPAMEKQRLRAAGIVGPEEGLPLLDAVDTPEPPAAFQPPMSDAPPAPHAADRMPQRAPETDASPPPVPAAAIVPPAIAAAPPVAPPPPPAPPLFVPEPPPAPAPAPVGAAVPPASAAPPSAPAPVTPRPLHSEARSPEPPVRPDAAAGATPRVPAEHEPALVEAFTAEIATGSRALSLLKQAEAAAETAASQSRAARRIASAMLVLFAIVAAGFGWWLMSGQRLGAGVGAGAGMAVAAAPIAVLSSPHAQAPPGFTASPAGSAPPASAPSAAAASPPPASATPPTTSAPPAPASPPGPLSAPAPIVGASAHAAPARATADDAPTARTARRHRHHRGRHARHRKHHRARHAHSVAFRSGSAGPAHAPHRSPAQEIHHVTDVAAPHGEAIDPALDRAGRAALCLRAAYSAGPGCAAVR